MHYHIILTEVCNSRCRYCYEKSVNDIGNKLESKFKFNLDVPPKSLVNVKELKSFLAKDKNPVVIFYGGEPLLEIEKIKEIIDNINVPFRIQTNGLLLNKLPIKYLKKIGKILVSIDGNKERTDFNRGRGNYDLVMNNIKAIKRKGYNGEIIARMTVSFPDIYEQVKHLLNNGFSSVHWQLDAGFYKNDFDYGVFNKFVNEYNHSISKLITFWINEMKNNQVIRLYPFLDITSDLLLNKKSRLRCGAGHAGYAISTDGKIVACPIMNGIETFVAGDLETDPQELKQFEITGRCLKCNIKDICGGRCLYWNKARLWPKAGDDLICSTIKHLISELTKALPKVKAMLKENKISMKQFEHEKYFGPEIIP